MDHKTILKTGVTKMPSAEIYHCRYVFYVVDALGVYVYKVEEAVEMTRRLETVPRDRLTPLVLVEIPCETILGTGTVWQKSSAAMSVLSFPHRGGCTMIADDELVRAFFKISRGKHRRMGKTFKD